MRIRNVIFPTLIIAFYALAACTRPISADFTGERQGLADDELFWVLRVPSEVNVLPWKITGTSSDSIEIRTFNKPVFEQVLPLLIRDLLEGKLTAYEDIEFSEEEKPITDLQERVARMSGTKDYLPYSSMFEVLSVVKSGRGNYSAEVRYIRILWRDPLGQAAERTLACVNMQELLRQNYTLRIGGTNVPFTDYLLREPYYYYPVYVRSNQVEYRLISAGEATFLKERVRNGHWDDVKWIEGAINISGRQWIELPPDQLNLMSGVFEFPATDSLSQKKVLYLETEQNYLLADWTHKFRNEKVFPFDLTYCFNAGGELLYFYPSIENNLDSVLFVSGPDTILGYRTRSF